jgi:hypothetical protein
MTTMESIPRDRAGAFTPNAQAISRRRRNRFILIIEAHLGRRDEAKPFVNPATFFGRMQYHGLDPLLARPVDDPLYCRGTSARDAS